MSSQFNPRGIPAGIKNPSAQISPSKPATNASDAVRPARVPSNHPALRPDMNPTGAVRDLSGRNPVGR
jgi:hypothetical protein